jgi:hypothetical protein
VDPSYTGEVARGKPHGKGVLYYKNGNHYDGSFQEGKLHGKGVFT